MNRIVTIGSPAPDLAYERPDGSEARLSELWSDGPALVVWARQCG